MTDQPWLDRVAAVDLALSVYRHPARYTDLLHGRGVLPDDLIEVIKLAVDAIRRRDETAASDERHHAALFFVEHVLLAAASDHYRVLGVKRSADEQALREHYRLMMAVFHPDRGGWQDGDREGLAARINLAHQVLRNPRQRADYDLELHRLDRTRVSNMRAPVVARAPLRGRVRRDVDATPWWSTLPIGVRQHFPQFVLSGIALLGVLVVFVAYLTRSAPGVALGEEAGKSAPVTVAVAERTVGEPAHPGGETGLEPGGAELASDGQGAAPAVGDDAAPGGAGGVVVADRMTAKYDVSPGAVNDVASQVESGELGDGARGVVAQRQVGAAQDVADQPSRPETTRAVETVAVAQVAKRDGVGGAGDRGQRTPDGPGGSEQRPAGGSGGAAPRAADRSGESVVSETREVPAKAAPPPVETTHLGPVLSPPAMGREHVARAPQASVRADEPDPPSGEAPRLEARLDAAHELKMIEALEVLSQFAQAYQRGDLNEFMSLFAHGVKSNSGGWGKIRADYDELFRSTRVRDIDFHQMRWTLTGDRGVAEGAFVARVQRRHGAGMSVHPGMLRLDLIKVNGRVLISGMFHEVAD